MTAPPPPPVFAHHRGRPRAARTRSCDRCGVKGAHLCEARAGRVVDVFEGGTLLHTKGRWARSPFRLDEWQRDEVIRPLFGEVEWSAEHGRWVRRYRIAWVELPRKNGKSEMLAGAGLVLLCADDEEGAEVYGCALDVDQARLVWAVAERMVALSPLLSRELKIYKQARRIVHERSGSFYEVVAGDALGNLGTNPHGVLFDEVITQRDAGLWDALRTGMGTRTQPLMLAATTAGNDPSSFAAEEHAYAERVLRDPRIDPRRFVFMRNTPKQADWRDEEWWRYSNPALGSFLSIEALRDEAREAALSPRRQNTFRQFRLNQWVQQVTRWLDLAEWDKGAGLVVEERLRHRPCVAGLDLASTTDLTALCLLFPPGGDDTEWHALWRCFVPADALERLDQSTAGQASVWAREGVLQTTEGNVLDYEAVRRQLHADAAMFEVREVGFDPWNSTEFVEQRLGEQDGFRVVPVRQGFATLSPASKELERLVLGHQLRHGGNPVARWAADNVVVRRDPAGNIKPDKQRSGEKIDPIVALIVAVSRALGAEPVRRSAYEDSDVVVA